jgi:hypothetical protein
MILNTVIAAFVAGFLTLCVFAFNWTTEQNTLFRKTCEQAGGTVVYDSRQYQCIHTKDTK